jgi:hypothetical protein
MPPRQAYAGFFPKLVLAFDVGTTFSGVSYCFLYPGEVPNIQSVNRCDRSPVVAVSWLLTRTQIPSAT